MKIDNINIKDLDFSISVDAIFGWKNERIDETPTFAEMPYEITTMKVFCDLGEVKTDSIPSGIYSQIKTKVLDLARYDEMSKYI